MKKSFFWTCSSFSFIIFKKIYNKVPGEYFGLIGSIAGIIGVGLAIFIYILTPGYTFGFDTTWVSQIGVGPNYSGLIFNISLLLIGIMLFFFGGAIFEWLKEKSRIIKLFSIVLFVMNIASVVGIFMVALDPMGTDKYVHVIGAQMFFILILIYILLFWISILIIHKQSKMHTIFTWIVLALAVCYAPIFTNAISQYYPGHTTATISFDQFIIAMSSPLPQLAGVRIVEWTLMIGVVVWILITSIYFKKYAHTDTKT